MKAKFRFGLAKNSSHRTISAPIRFKDSDNDYINRLQNTTTKEVTRTRKFEGVVFEKEKKIEVEISFETMYAREFGDFGFMCKAYKIRASIASELSESAADNVKPINLKTISKKEV